MKAAISIVMLALVVGAAAAAQRTGPVLSQSQSLETFQARVNDYVTLHKKVLSTAKPLPKEATAQQIETSQQELSKGIASARVNAKPGDIFTKETQDYLRGVLAKIFGGPKGGQLRASVLDENPIGTPVRVNGPYPDAIPLSTTPPQLLDALPTLPPELEYHFVGERLILYDHHAHLIVDFIDSALPGV